MPDPKNHYHTFQLEQYLNELRLPRKVVKKVLDSTTIDEKIRADERADKRANVGYDSYKRLNDFYDFRPRVEDITGASSNIDTVGEITGFSFDFKSKFIFLSLRIS